MILLVKANFGGWGGIAYSWDIYELSEMYCRMFAGAALCGNNCMFAVSCVAAGRAVRSTISIPTNRSSAVP